MAGADNYETKPNNPSLLNPTFLSAQTSPCTNICLIDTPLSLQKIKTEIKQANIIILVYDLSNLETIAPLAQHWLPLIQKCDPSLSVILLGNKYDLVMDDKEKLNKSNTVRILRMLFREFKQLELGIEVSVKMELSIREALYSAQIIILYPIGKLMDKRDRGLTRNFRIGIKRIFRILDRDCSGWLSDRAIMEMQEKVFHLDLSDLHLNAIKDIIEKDLGEHSTTHGINLKAFEVLFAKLVDLVKIQNCWTILKFYGYDYDLKLSVDEEEIKVVGANEYYCVLLGKKFEKFLDRIFGHFSSNKYWLNKGDIERIFESVYFPFLEDIFQVFPFFQNEDFKFYEKDWKLFWTYFCNFDFKQAFLLAKYICWEYSPSDMIETIHDTNPLMYYRKSFRKNFLKIIAISSENEFSGFIEDFNRDSFFVHREHFLISGNKKNLIIKKLDFEKVIKNNYSLLNFTSYDMIWIFEKDFLKLKKTFDKIFNNMPKNIPKLALLTKNGMEVKQKLVFKKYGISFIIKIHELTNEKKEEIFDKSFQLLKNPYLGLTEEFVEEHKVPLSNFNKGLLTLGACLAIGGIFYFKYFKNSKK